MRFGSLFSGVGGMDLGLERAGMECAWQVEIDPRCREVLRRHWPDVKQYEDVTTCAGLESVDLICGGFPCQDLSVAGKRGGLDGARSGLWWEFHRIIGEMRDATRNEFPKWVVIENVPGLFSSNSGADFGVLLDSLADLGAVVVEWCVLDAQFFGVPQRRKRVFIVACFDPAIECPDPLLPVREGGGGDSPQGREAGEEPAAGAGRGFTSVGGDVAAPLLSSGGGPRTTDIDGGTWVIESAFVQNQRDEVREVPVAMSLAAEPGMKQQTFVKVVRSGARDEDGNLPAEVWGERDVAPTMNAFDNGGESRATVLMAQQSGVRRLTPLECERLMGWPDEHTRWDSGGKELPDSARYRMAGNGVVAPVAEWIGTQIGAGDGA